MADDPNPVVRNCVPYNLDKIAKIISAQTFETKLNELIIKK